MLSNKHSVCLVIVFVVTCLFAGHIQDLEGKSQGVQPLEQVKTIEKRSTHKSEKIV